MTNGSRQASLLEDGLSIGRVVFMQQQQMQEAKDAAASQVCCRVCALEAQWGPVGTIPEDHTPASFMP